MSAIETLRKAAEKLQANAQRATAGPWSAECIGSEGYRVYGPRGERGSARERRRQVTAAAIYENFEICKADASYIAAMHPGVGLAFAEWFEKAADSAEAVGATWDPLPGSTYAAAHAAARAVLGES